jgi:hypothetical protein
MKSFVKILGLLPTFSLALTIRRFSKPITTRKLSISAVADKGQKTGWGTDEEGVGNLRDATHYKLSSDMISKLVSLYCV